MDKFVSKQSKKNDTTSGNRTHSAPTHCNVCQKPIPEDRDEARAESFVYLCEVKNIATENNVYGAPGKFLQKDSHGNYSGDSSSGWVLQDRFRFVRWHCFCGSCHAKQTMLDAPHRKTNQVVRL